MNVATKKKDGPDNLYLLNNRYKNAHVANKTAWTHHSTAGPFKHFTSVDFTLMINIVKDTPFATMQLYQSTTGLSRHSQPNNSIRCWTYEQ